MNVCSRCQNIVLSARTTNLLLRSVISRTKRNTHVNVLKTEHQHKPTQATGCRRVNSVVLTSRKYGTDENEKMKKPIAQTTIDEEEVKKFAAQAQLWWDEGGEFEALHTMNELRVPLIRDILMKEGNAHVTKPLAGSTIVDVGSGGGILAEPLARLGAFVIGLDASKENINTAQAHMMHDPALSQRIKYIHATVEDLVETEEGKFDAVIASEVVEHVADAKTFLSGCCKLVKPGGSLFLTTINKTYASYAFGVVAAEQVLNIVSPGTHNWNKFIDPQDIQVMLNQNNFRTRLIHGMMYNPFTKRWSWAKNTSINYAIHAVRGGTEESETDP